MGKKKVYILHVTAEGSLYVKIVYSFRCALEFVRNTHLYYYLVSFTMLAVKFTRSLSLYQILTFIC